MSNLVKTDLEQQLRALCKTIGETADLAMLRRQFIVANGLWARIERLTFDEPKSA